MQEEVTQKTIALAVRTSKLTAEVLRKVMKMYLESQKQRANQPKHGKQSVRELVGQNAGVSNIEISDGNIRAFERVAKKYRVDFAVTKDKSVTPPKYLVFFKGRDADVLTQAFKEFVRSGEKQKGKKRISVKQKLAYFKEVLAESRGKEHQKDREQSL